MSESVKNAVAEDFKKQTGHEAKGISQIGPALFAIFDENGEMYYVRFS